MYVSTQDELKTLLDMIKGAPVLAIDTEFHSEKTYYSKLCLIQFGTDEVNAIIDPLAIKDLTPLADILTDPNTVKVFHAGNQDLEILNRATGVVPNPLFDTQVAAGLLGHPQQLGYGALVKAMCDVQLAKADSFTDWTRRPLSKNQIEYAKADVLYLPGIYRTMIEKLEKAGRLEWLKRDFDHMTDPHTYKIDPEEMWRKVRRISSLTRRQLAIVRVVAAWRERTAQKRNLPRKWVVSDEMVVEIARRVPSTVESLCEVRGIGEHLSQSSMEEIVVLIEEALKTDPETWPKVGRRGKSHGDSEGAVDLMLALLHLRAKENGVAMQFLGSREDMVKVVNGDGDDIPIMEGWRRELVGDELLQLLEGKLCLSVEDGALKVTECCQGD